jgi:hypothetical protein
MSVLAVALSLWAVHATAALSVLSRGSFFVTVVVILMIGPMISPDNLVLLEGLSATVSPVYRPNGPRRRGDLGPRV